MSQILTINFFILQITLKYKNYNKIPFLTLFFELLFLKRNNTIYKELINIYSLRRLLIIQTIKFFTNLNKFT